VDRQNPAAGLPPQAAPRRGAGDAVRSPGRPHCGDGGGGAPGAPDHPQLLQRHGDPRILRAGGRRLVRRREDADCAPARVGQGPVPGYQGRGRHPRVARFWQGGGRAAGPVDGQAQVLLARAAGDDLHRLCARGAVGAPDAVSVRVFKPPVCGGEENVRD